MIHNWDQKIERDAWYTSPLIADNIVQWAKNNVDATIRTIVEPSAGNGSFVKAITKHYPNKKLVAMDIEPRSSGIKKKDYLTFLPQKTNEYFQDKNKVLVIGNPPYGVKSSLAMKFIKHSAKFADHIVFLLSENFRNSEIFKNQLPEGFSIVKILKLPKNIFVSENGDSLNLSMNTCAFYFRFTGKTRKTITVKPNGKWEYVKKTDRQDGHLRVSRMGNQGYFKCSTKNSNDYWIYTPYDYFIKINIPSPSKHAQRICNQIEKHNFQGLVSMGSLSSLRVKQLTKFLNKITSV